MAKVELNSAVGGLRGKMDGWVYRQRYGKTSVMPLPSPKKQRPSRAQRDHREQFRAAQAYAAEVLADPLRREVYQKLGAERQRPPNTLLISNFLTPPTIERIELAGYTGRAGEVIKVLANDLIEVVEVAVRIVDADGRLHEGGPAGRDHGIWIYRTTTASRAGSKHRIEVTARNRAAAEARQGVEMQ